jgi:type IV secretory pathway VirB10-like protein
MNPKQTAPLIAKLATIAPPLLFGVAIYYGLKWLFPDEDEKKKSETTPASAETESRRKEAETGAFRPIPAENPVKPAAAPAAAVIPPLSVTPAPKVSSPAPVPAAVAIPKIATQAAPPPPIKKKFVSRKDLATVFHRGERALTRTAAVAALKNLGFGKTAAYEALSSDGRFASWLKIASDGMITWKA